MKTEHVALKDVLCAEPYQLFHKLGSECHLKRRKRINDDGEKNKRDADLASNNSSAKSAPPADGGVNPLTKRQKAAERKRRQRARFQRCATESSKRI